MKKQYVEAIYLDKKNVFWRSIHLAKGFKPLKSVGTWQNQYTRVHFDRLSLLVTLGIIGSKSMNKIHLCTMLE